MADTHDGAASEAARQLVARRWGSQAVERAAAVVIPRAGELPAATRAALHEATAPPGGEPDGED
jgi:hypothetical protein